ncbi:4-hydroxy-tetrahydrodipicolinate synthase [Pigmentiphaga soli]|uniref:4-hydroxy-tetrahydrodipicolinate synthase n=1 Tax=Pigmentiphaga soli TaxID=1007095 RepID=A0ABP8H3T5_9BURK
MNGMNEKFHGVVPAVATPFGDGERLDTGRLRELIDDYIACGVDGISVAGSQGEFFSLDYDEHVRLLETTMDAVAGRVPVYAGTGGVTTRGSIRLTQVAQSLQVDLALLITPYFVQPTQDELAEHFTAVARATELPVMLYNNPPRTGVNVQPSTLVRCMAAPNVVGVKDSSGDITQTVEYLLASGRRALVFSGRDTIFQSLMMHGGHGTISPAANVFPKLVVAQYRAARAGDWAEAGRIHDIMAPLREAWALGSFPVVIKEAMRLVGRDAGLPRRPIAGLSSDRLAKLKAVCERIGAEEARL